MKLKKVRVRLKDIHHGKILYVAHPALGIERVKIVGKPKTVMLGAVCGLKGWPSLFIDTIPLDYDWWLKGDNDSRSLSDMGVYNMYGYRRTFHTKKQAERYVERMKNCPKFQKDEAHRIRSLDDDFMFEYPFDDE